MKVIKPQTGFQELFLSSSADIVIGGGSAGAGKTFGLLLDPLRYLKVKGFGAVLFRRTYPQITLEGGLLDESKELYPCVGGIFRESDLKWTFPDKTNITFRHLQHDKNLDDYQGAQIPWIGFDELTHFSKRMFFYLLSRNRSTCGVNPCIRATCNPDPDSWLTDFISWWVDEDGFPIEERKGKIRYMTQDKGIVVWGDTVEEVLEKAPHVFEHEEINIKDLVKSVTFIGGNIHENKELLKKNPQYLGSLLALDEDEKLRFYEGNWKVRIAGNMIADHFAVDDIFSNYTEESIFKCITCDAARLGRDFTVIAAWKGWELVHLTVLTISEVKDIVEAIEKVRMKFIIQKSKVLVDQDGVGGGTVKMGGYQGFSGGSPAKKDADIKMPENYENFKTQCVYRLMWENVNEGNIKININSENCIVDNNRTTRVKVKGQVHDIRDLIKKDLRSYRSEERTREGKLKIESKDKQKIILDGRSPDFGDVILMRKAFDIKKEFNVYV